MNAEQEITNYYNENYEKSKPAIIEALCHLLGEEYRELITKKVNSFEIIYTVTRKKLKRCLRNPELDSSEKKLMEYFLDKMDNCKNFDFDKMSLKDLVAFLEANNMVLSDSKKTILEEMKKVLDCIESSGLDSKEIEENLKEIREFCKKNPTTSPNYHFIGKYGEHHFSDLNGCTCSVRTYNNQKLGAITLPIYDDEFSPDNNYFWGILDYILDSKELGDLYTGIAYDKIEIYFGIILAHELHKKGLFIFDNKNLTKNEKMYEKMRENEVFKKIKQYFGPLFSEFLFNPDKVIDLVGKDNFRKFALWLLYLAPRLNDDIDITEEELEDIDLSEKIDIPYDELDIVIMEVLDDMYVEYLKHQEISIITFDIPKIKGAQKSLAAKRERDRKADSEDSCYYDITRVFKYLEQYGNCQIRFVSSNKTCNMVDFRINKEGKLVIMKKIEVYDKFPFTLDGNINSNAKLLNTVELATYDEQKYDMVMSAILYYSLNGMTRIKTNRDLKSSSKDATRELYDVLYPMYDLDLEDLIHWAKSTPRGQMNILMKPRNNNKDNYNFQIIECKTRTLSQKIATVIGYWQRVQNACTDEEDEKAMLDWEHLEQGILKL